MATVYTVMAYGGMVLAVICLILTVILFVGWDIPKVFGDITGRTEKKTIERIQRDGYGTNGSKQDAIKKAGQTAQIKVRKTITDGLAGGISDKIKNKRLVARGMESNQEVAATREHTEMNREMRSSMAEDFNPEEDTTVLANEEIEEETMVLNGANEETTLLSVEEEATMVLEAKGIPGVIHLPNEVFTQAGTVEPVLDFVVIHTEEEVS